MLKERIRTAENPIDLLKKATEQVIFGQKLLGEFPTNCNPAIYEKELERVTAGNCICASEALIRHLKRNHREIFSTFLMLESHREVGEAYKKPYKEDIGILHYYYLVQDNFGTWHAGSPANHRKDSGDNSRLERIISGSLKEVLETIENVEGGVWPSEEELLERLNNLKGKIRENEYFTFFNKGMSPLEARIIQL